MSNPFLDVAERQIVGPRKSRMRAVEKRNAKLEAKKEEQGILFKQWQKWKEERRKELMDGPHGAAATALSNFLDTMTVEQSAELIEHVKLGPWKDTDADTRFQVLDMVSRTIIYLREQLGLEPMDDAIPGSDDEPGVFEIVKDILK